MVRSVLTRALRRVTIPAVDDEPDLDPREAARVRRRDHDADAERRDLMRPGMGKVFKQITDSWGDKAAPGRRGDRKPERDDA
jgi:hypothetical protein